MNAVLFWVRGFMLFSGVCKAWAGKRCCNLATLSPTRYMERLKQVMTEIKSYSGIKLVLWARYHESYRYRSRTDGHFFLFQAFVPWPPYDGFISLWSLNSVSVFCNVVHSSSPPSTLTYSGSFEMESWSSRKCCAETAATTFHVYRKCPAINSQTVQKPGS